MNHYPLTSLDIACCGHAKRQLLAGADPRRITRYLCRIASRENGPAMVLELP